MATIAVALWFWSSLYRKVENWLWWIVTLSLVLFLFHAGGHFYAGHPVWTGLTHASSIANAALILLAVHLTRRGLAKAQALEHELQAKDQLLCELTNRVSAAQQMAELLGGYKDQIAFYEQQAKANKLPTFTK